MSTVHAHKSWLNYSLEIHETYCGEIGDTTEVVAHVNCPECLAKLPPMSEKMKVVSLKEHSWGWRMEVQMPSGDIVELMSFHGKGKPHNHKDYEHAVCTKGRGTVWVDGAVLKVGDRSHHYELTEITVPPGCEHFMESGGGDVPLEFAIFYSEGASSRTEPTIDQADENGALIAIIKDLKCSVARDSQGNVVGYADSRRVHHSLPVTP